MKYVSLILSEDAAHECVHILGELGALQFTDLNPEQTAFQRRYVTYVKRCDELERKLRFILKEIETFGLPVMPAPVVDFEARSPLQPSTTPRSSSALLDALESELEKYERQLLELSNYSGELTAKYNEKIEFQECLEKGKNFFESEAGALVVESPPGGPAAAEDGMQPLLGDHFAGPGGLAGQSIQRTIEGDMKFSSTVGVLNAHERARFERMLFRSTRGNCLARFCEVERPIADAASGKPENKMVFIIFFKSDVIGAIIDKICVAFGARQYPVPDHATLGDATRLRKMIHETTAELADAREVLIKNRELRLALCSRLAQRYHEWNRVVLREKIVYHVLNLFRADVSGMLRAEAWIVASAEPEARALVARIHATMDLAGASMLAHVPLPWPSPPTSFKTNEFTYAFQEFVNTYGIPRYKEINPAPFTAVTFPFLFGMMYGDVGHGTCVLLGGTYLIVTYPGYTEENISTNRSEMLGGIYAARYMLTAMGACSVYVGLVYNDCFSLALAIFDSGYRWEGAEDGVAGPVSDGAVATSTSSYGSSGAVYPFGVDPVWHISGNELLFFNSMKMKIAVIFGVLQMTCGILLKGLNALYFGDGAVFCLEFVPMIIFDCCLFIYMVVLIFTKWAIDWDWRQLQGSCSEGMTYNGHPCSGSDPLKEKCALDFGGDTGGCAPPNLINQLINIALNPGVVDEPMYDGQGSTQSALLAVAFLSVPVLLLGKPIYVYFQQHGGQGSLSHQQASTQIEMDHDNGGLTENLDSDVAHSLSEVLIHQCIETIEFVLGMVSNTASYLRLWALSLAHTELAQVFWEKTMRTAINTNNGFFIFIAYSIFAVVTAAVLLAMDLLECFLHALRLHWVEFQNKFYKADGLGFAPFKFPI